MLLGEKHVGIGRVSVILILLVGWCLLGVPAAEATVYDANADFSVTNGNPNGVWTYGWAAAVADLPAGLHIYSDEGTAPFGNGDFQRWFDINNLYENTPTVVKNFGADYDNGNIVIPAGALYLHGQVLAPMISLWWNSWLPRLGPIPSRHHSSGVNTSINYGLVYILENGTTLFDNGGAYITTVGDTATYSANINLVAGDKIDFVVGNLSIGPDSIELRAVFNTSPVPVPPTFLLLGFGLLRLVGWRKGRKI